MKSTINKQLLEDIDAHAKHLRFIYRIKGFVNVPNKPMRMVLQGVGDRLETSYDRLWASDEARQTRLVFIGQSLERSQIEAALRL